MGRECTCARSNLDSLSCPEHGFEAQQAKTVKKAEDYQHYAQFDGWIHAVQREHAVDDIYLAWTACGKDAPAGTVFEGLLDGRRTKPPRGVECPGCLKALEAAEPGPPGPPDPPGGKPPPLKVG